ncbi:MAG: DNA polymerase IV [Candidatus Harrisonbacteria bacterium]|nr:DNA polymerase IV [Candidatus Harrisonbacteria bacterium]
MQDRIIFHIDMDAFFAAVEERDKPRLKGRPIVVGSDPKDGKGRGVVSTANYKAREYGIHSAMPISKAWQLSRAASADGKAPVVFVSTDMNTYSRVSRAIMGYLKEEGDMLEQASIDEAYLDVSDEIRIRVNPEKAWWRAERLAAQIKARIKTRQRLTASIGVGPNKLIAKIASGQEKPDGLTVIPPGKVRAFLDPMAVEALPGIGPKTKARLNVMGIKTLQELRLYDVGLLQKEFGKRALDWHQRAQGIDESPVQQSRGRKSIGKQITFAQDTLDPEKIIKTMKEIVSDVVSQMKSNDLKSKTFTITVRFENFETRTRSESILAKTNDESELRTIALNLLLPFFDNRENWKRKKIRLIGFRAEHIAQRYEKF